MENFYSLMDKRQAELEDQQRQLTGQLAAVATELGDIAAWRERSNARPAVGAAGNLAVASQDGTTVRTRILQCVGAEPLTTTQLLAAFRVGNGGPSAGTVTSRLSKMRKFREVRLDASGLWHPGDGSSVEDR